MFYNRKVLVFKKIDIKLIEANKDYNKEGGENCVQLKVNDGNNEIIILKFENRNKRKDFKDLINEKIMTSGNDERLLFSQYFEGLVSNFKNEDTSYFHTFINSESLTSITRISPSKQPVKIKKGFFVSIISYISFL